MDKMKNTDINAQDFYNSIPKEELFKYKLVNHGFIIKLSDNPDIYSFIGYLHKHNTVSNNTKKNKVEIASTNQSFNLKTKEYTTTLGFWRPFNINFEVKEIDFILLD